MSQTQQEYEKLHQMSRHARVLVGISHLLDWDQETYMPPGASDIRSEQLKTLAGLIHVAKTGKPFAIQLAKLIDLPTGKIASPSLSPAQSAALKVWRREFLKAKALPKAFVENFAQLQSQSVLAWRSAKKEDQFQAFAPFLTKLIDMLRKKADYVGYSDHPYDALLDDYEPGATTKGISKEFGKLRQSLTALLKSIASRKQVDDRFLFGNFSQDTQLAFSKKLLQDLDYRSDHGRLDFSSHPFSSASHPTDSRITTRFHSNSLMSCISVVLHEGGHAFYEMGLPTDQYGSPLGDAISLGIHESQSRWWETRIGQSRAFWSYYLPQLKKSFPSLEKIGLDAFYKGINKVEPSLIRVEADEVTYSLHVILRFELERALIEGSLKIKEIPEAWNAKMQELLGLTPPNNREGCLQDIHWSMGAFGYFPTYTLGNLYAAHLFLAFAKDYPDWEKRLARGELLFIRKWLTEHVHQHGRRYSSLELLKKVTGKPFTSQAFIDYLQEKYSHIYGF